jgi:hypothetical protein
VIHNISGTLEEAARILSRMSHEERSEFYAALFKYDRRTPVELITEATGQGRGPQRPQGSLSTALRTS